MSAGPPGAQESGDAGEAGGDAITADALRAGRVRIFQPARGARMSLDPVLLEGFLAPPHGRFLDIGCGSGALSFLLLARDPAATGVGVELQPRLAALAVRGRDANGWQQRLEIVVGDARDLRNVGRDTRIAAASFDLVATNPPYRTVAGSRRPPDDERALAHLEVALALADWVAFAARAVRPGGRVAAIFPAERAVDLLAELRARDLNPIRLRPVHPRAGEPAARVLVEAERGAGRGSRPFVLEPALVLHADGARYTPEVLRMLDEA
ncbi:MAG TPA: methyltransferase [Polyangia bacterium]